MRKKQHKTDVDKDGKSITNPDLHGQPVQETSANAGWLIDILKMKALHKIIFDYFKLFFLFILCLAGMVIIALLIIIWQDKETIAAAFGGSVSFIFATLKAVAQSGSY